MHKVTIAAVARRRALTHTPVSHAHHAVLIHPRDALAATQSINTVRNDLLSRVFDDHLRTLLTDHDRRCIGVARRQHRHHGSVNDA